MKIQLLHHTFSVEDEFLSSLKIYPNPVKDFLKIELPVNYSNAKVEIYDIYGRYLSNSSISTNVNEIDVSNLNSGVYMFRIVLKNKFGIHKFIKM
ncbi:T9SS type A sorting domain-containing protein [Lutibacter sp.]|uniref:T9SS type A sorting domain-containing protein n=1 Tax=Lutibacter sp. TaxID=1925666 RepID=UPI0038CD83DC